MSATTPVLNESGGFAPSLVLLWVSLYTIGLGDAARERRRAEVESDLWEHYSDRRDEGAAPAAIGIETIGRAARGVASDLLWRFGVEGPKVQLNIPIERLGGAFLVALVAATMLSLNAAGYDPGLEGFDGELRRLAGIEDYQVTVYAGFQVLAGLGMVLGAVVICLALRRYAATTALLAAVALAAAGLLTLTTSAIYATAAELADEYVTATADHQDVVLTTARAFVIVLNSMVPITGTALALGVYGFAFIAGRHHLVPSWLQYVVALSVIAFATSLVAGLSGEDSGILWLSFMLTFGLLMLWLLIAGGWLLLGGSAGRREGLAGHDTETFPSPAA